MSIYPSCTYLQGGLALRSGTVSACGVVHHGRGTPVLGEYHGGPLPIEELLRRRRLVNDGRHPSCTGCPFLVEKVWEESRYSITWLGITNFNYCNIACDYCWLQWAEYSPRQKGVVVEKPYAILPIVEMLIDDALLAPSAIIDWGGGGESTIMPDFDRTFEVLNDYGTTQWLHTNAVRLPTPIGRNGRLDRKRVRVLCSVDAGRAETFKAIKVRDRFDQVVTNLAAYSAAGAYVAAKYILSDLNRSREELNEFLMLMRKAGVNEVIGDLDYRAPNPSNEIIEALAYLKLRCASIGMPFQLGSTGVNHAREFGVPARVEMAFFELGLGLAVDASRPLPQLASFFTPEAGTKKLLDSPHPGQVALQPEAPPAVAHMVAPEPAPAAEQLVERTLRVRAIAFSDVQLWEFADSNGPFSAKMLDANFMDRLRTGRRALRVGEALRVLLRPAGDAGTTAPAAVLHVLDG
jgi:hypothetical protein